MLFPHFVDMILDEKDVGSPSIGLYLDGLMFAGFHEIVPEFQRDTLVKNLTLIQRFASGKKKFIAQSKEKYDKKSDVHEQKLMKIWDILMPNQKLTDRLTNDWQTIGFQAKDPATDFRGAGCLGLYQLLAICDPDQSFNYVSVLEMFKDSTNERHWYFFCVTGLNITRKLLDVIQPVEWPKFYKKKVDEYLMRMYIDVQPCTKEEDEEWFFEIVTHEIYFKVFKRFNEQWVKSECNIMQFTQFLDDVFESVLCKLD